jgi:hypothetical protein
MQGVAVRMDVGREEVIAAELHRRKLAAFSGPLFYIAPPRSGHLEE